MDAEKLNPIQHGSIEVICGSMFSGKTEELIRRIKRAQLAKQKVELYKPETDARYHKYNIVSHDQREMPGITVRSSSEILEKTARPDVIGIDEVQFFDEDIVSVCSVLANSGIRVIIAGLDMDYLGKPFGSVPQLLSIAEDITKVHAICLNCGNPAQFSYRMANSTKLVLTGEQKEYMALCRKCYLEKNK